MDKSTHDEAQETQQMFHGMYPNTNKWARWYLVHLSPKIWSSFSHNNTENT